MFGFVKNVLICTLIFLAIIFYFVYIRPTYRRRKAARLAAEEQRRIQNEIRLATEASERERAEREAKWQRAKEQKETEIERAISQFPESQKYRLDHFETDVTYSQLNITDFTPISKKRYIAFDLETTGLDPVNDHIVEIGAVLVENGIITLQYQQLINPGIPMPAGASAVNHITDDMLDGMPMIHQVLPSFRAFIGDDVLAAHNSKFDMGFMCQACMRNRFACPTMAFDTMNLSRYWPESSSRKLTSLLSAAGLEIDDAHRALGDARGVAALIAATNQRRSDSRKKKSSAKS